MEILDKITSLMESIDPNYRQYKQNINESLLLESKQTKKVKDLIRKTFDGILNMDGVVRSHEYYVNNNPNTTWIEYLMHNFRHTFCLMNNSDDKYLPLVAQLAYSNEVRFDLTDNNVKQKNTLIRIVRVFKTNDDIFRECNAQKDNITFHELSERFQPIFESEDKADTEAADNVPVSDNGYDIIEVPDFETVHRIGMKSCSQSTLCFAESMNVWNGYKGDNDENRAYVCLKHGWEDIPEEMTEGYPYDDYGLSMIFVFIGPADKEGNGEIVTSHTRWNHGIIRETNFTQIYPTATYVSDCDHVLTKTTLSQIVGKPFSSTFKPYPNDEEEDDESNEFENNGLLTKKEINYVIGMLTSTASEFQSRNNTHDYEKCISISEKLKNGNIDELEDGEIFFLKRLMSNLVHFYNSHNLEMDVDMPNKILQKLYRIQGNRDSNYRDDDFDDDEDADFEEDDERFNISDREFLSNTLLNMSSFYLDAEDEPNIEMCRRLSDKIQSCDLSELDDREMRFIKGALNRLLTYFEDEGDNESYEYTQNLLRKLNDSGVNESRINRIVRNSIRSVIKESIRRNITESRQGLRSQILYNAMKQHGGFASKYSADYHNLKDEDIVAFLKPEDWYRANDEEYCRKLADERGIKLKNTDTFYNFRFNDGTIVLFVLRNGLYDKKYNPPVTTDEFDAYMRKRDERERNRYYRNPYDKNRDTTYHPGLNGYPYREFYPKWSVISKENNNKLAKKRLGKKRELRHNGIKTEPLWYNLEGQLDKEKR